MKFLEWAYKYGFTLIAGIILLGVVLYYTHILDVRSYDNAIQLQQVNSKIDEMKSQMTRIELKVTDK
jgi:CHASE3 domain sensor protein